MAHIVQDSFYFPASSTLLDWIPYPWDSVTGTVIYGTGSTHTRFNYGRAITPNGPMTAFKASGRNKANQFAACAFGKTNTLGGSSQGICLQWYDGATVQCTVAFYADGSIKVLTGGTGGSVAATYAGAFPGIAGPSAWNQFQFKVVIHNTAGEIHIRKNGNTSDDFSATGLNTRGGTSNNYANGFGLNYDFGGDGDQWLQDLWAFDDDAGSYPSTWVGDYRMVAQMPSADTAQKDWTPNSGSNNYDRVSELPEDGDTTYVSSSTPTNLDLYNVAACPITPLSILQVAVRGITRKDDAGLRQVAGVNKSSGTTTVGATFTLNTTYQGFGDVYHFDPNTAALWTLSNLNALQVGPKLIA